jgi:hypothetical protein
MIISKNTHPERDLYYLGGKVIEILASSKNVKYDYFELYAQVNNIQSISLNLYILVLDWLFILGVVKNSSKGFIEKCF